MKTILFLVLSCLLFVGMSYGDVTGWWDHDCSEPDIVGFRLYYGETQGQWSILIASIDCPNTSITLPDLPEGYYIVKAYDTEDFESDPSNEILLAAYYYNSILYDYDSSGRVIYKGEHTDQDADINDTNWIISKYYYNTNGIVIKIRRRTMSWTNRTQGW